MLRSLDVPARFTSGYVVTVSPNDVGRVIELTDANAHAWVEVYYEDVGWLYLEVTPPDENAVIPNPRPHNPEANIPSPLPIPAPDSIPDAGDPLDSLTNSENNRDLQDETEGSSSPRQSFSPWVRNLSIFVISIAIIAVALPSRRNVMGKIRARRFKSANTNDSVIYIWRYILRLSYREASPPDDIEAIALKARFSQHRLTEEERETMAKYARRLAYEITTGKGELGRFFLKYIRAVC